MQETKCPACGSTDCIEGKLEAAYGLVFVPKEQKGKIRKMSSSVTALACRDCGEVFGFKLSNTPCKLTK